MFPGGLRPTVDSLLMAHSSAVWPQLTSSSVKWACVRVASGGTCDHRLRGRCLASRVELGRDCPVFSVLMGFGGSDHGCPRGPACPGPGLNVGSLVTRE